MTKFILLVTALFSLSSCKNGNEKDPDVVKYEEQKVELEGLEAELTELRIQTAAVKTKGPETPVDELRKNLEAKEAELKKLNEEFEVLKKSEELAVKELEKLKEQIEGR